MAELGVTIPPVAFEWSSIKHPNRNRAIKGHLFPTLVLQTSQIRGCPECLRLDIEGTDAPPHLAMAMRGDWLVPHVTVCLKHRHPLVPLWRDAKPYSRLDSAVQLAAIAPEILSKKLHRETCSPTSFDLWVENRLCNKGAFNWLDNHSLHVASNFCFMLGCALSPEIASGNPSSPTVRQALANQLGFSVASQGEEAIYNALNVRQRLPGKPHDGARNIFPVLYERLAHTYRENQSYEPFRQILRNHMLKTWPLGIGDEVFGEPIIVRRLHSVRTAATSTGIDQRRLFKMLNAKGIVKDSKEGGTDQWEVFDARLAEPLLNELTEYVPASTFAALISANRSQFALLVADGTLVPALLGSESKAIWNPRDGEVFLDKLLRRSVQLLQVPLGWIHISKSAQRLKISPGEIIRAINNGKITQVGNYTRYRGYGAIYVVHEEVAAVVGNSPPPAQSIEVFSKLVGVNQPSKMRRLVVNHHTPSTVMQNPRTKADQHYISSENAKAFHAAFMTPRTMSAAYERSWQSIGAELKAKAVQPFSPDGEDYGSLFLREDVEVALK